METPIWMFPKKGSPQVTMAFKTKPWSNDLPNDLHDLKVPHMFNKSAIPSGKLT